MNHPGSPTMSARSSRPLRHLLAAALTALGLCLVVAACGGGGTIPAPGVNYNAIAGFDNFYVGPLLSWAAGTGPIVNQPVLLLAHYGSNHNGFSITTGGTPASTVYATSFNYAPGAIFNTIESYNGRDLGGLGLGGKERSGSAGVCEIPVRACPGSGQGRARLDHQLLELLQLIAQRRHQRTYLFRVRGAEALGRREVAARRLSTHGPHNVGGDSGGQQTQPRFRQAEGDVL